MNSPNLITGVSFQDAWKQAVLELATHQFALYNLVVHIADPDAMDGDVHQAMVQFAQGNDLLSPDQVADTIFPARFYDGPGTATRLYERYNRPRGVFARTRRMARRGWGTYFHRMTCYPTPNGIENQLDRVVKAINSRRATHKAAYTVVIPHPGSETVRSMGGPCLSYIAVQLEPGNPRRLGALAVYRNHDFLHRAYGNYQGLCRLIRFLCSETESVPGPLTCISSHAYVDKLCARLKSFVERL